MKKIRMAIVGTGKASHMHARVLKKLDEAELAAYSATASLILNLDEVITKQ